MALPRYVEYNRVSEHHSLESVVAITSEPRKNSREMTLRHTGVPDDEMRRKHAGGKQTACVHCFRVAKTTANDLSRVTTDRAA